jgi:hypothetical protein
MAGVFSEMLYERPFGLRGRTGEGGRTPMRAATSGGTP